MNYNDYKEKLKKFDSIQLKEAVYIQNKLQFLTLPFSKPDYAPEYYNEYLRKIKNKISNQAAYNRFQENIPYPLPTNEFIKTVFNSLSKVFDGDGRYIEYNPENSYKTIGFDYAKRELWEKYMFAPNSFILTWKEKESVERKFIDVSCVEYIKCDGDTINEFGYKNGNETIYINETELFIWEDEKDKENYKHNYGFCPVDFLSNLKLSYRKPLIRINNIVTSLGDIEELLTVSILSNVINRYILPYVVQTKKTGEEAGCNYRTLNSYCNNGYLYAENRDGIAVSLMNDGVPAKCPQCNKEIGFGSVLEIPARNMSADEFEKAAKNAISYQSLGVESLDYPDKKKKQLETEIYNKIVNKQDSLNNAQQHNEIRVQATMEDKTSVLINLKRVFENILARLITKDIQLIKKTYKSTYVNLGTKFFLQSAEEYQELIKTSRANGTIDYVDYDKALIEVKYGENQKEKNRKLFILEIEKAARPYRNLTNEQILSMKDSISPEDLNLALNFHKKIRELELKEGKSILDMFPEKEKEVQIGLIINKLKS